MSKSLNIIIAVLCTIVAAVSFIFIKNNTVFLLVREGILFLTIVTLFVVWKRCGVDDEDKIFWLGLWVSLLSVFLISFVGSMVRIINNTEIISDYSMVLYAFAFGICVLIFGSNLEIKVPKWSSITFKTIIILVIIGGAIYINTLAPTNTRVIFIDGEKIGGSYLFEGLIFMSIAFFALFNTVILQLKMYFSYMKPRLDLWLSTSALYLVLIQLFFVVTKPTLLFPPERVPFIEYLGSYSLVAACVLLIFAGIHRYKLGNIEEIKNDKFKRQIENRMPISNKL